MTAAATTTKKKKHKIVNDYDDPCHDDECGPTTHTSKYIRIIRRKKSDLARIILCPVVLWCTKTRLLS
jgi:hypothetical protein